MTLLERSSSAKKAGDLRPPSTEEALGRVEEAARTLVQSIGGSDAWSPKNAAEVVALKSLLRLALPPGEQDALPPLPKSQERFFGPKTQQWIEAFRRKIDLDSPPSLGKLGVDRPTLAALMRKAAESLVQESATAQNLAAVTTRINDLANSIAPRSPQDSASLFLPMLALPPLRGDAKTGLPSHPHLTVNELFSCGLSTVELLKGIHDDNKLARKHYRGQPMSQNAIVEYLAAVHKVADELGVPPSAVLTVNYAETAFTMHPKVGPPGGTARGLFQPILATLKEMANFFVELRDRLMRRGKVSHQAVEQMNREQQIDLFKNYIEMKLQDLGYATGQSPQLTLTGLYSLVFAPKVFNEISGRSPEEADATVVYEARRNGRGRINLSRRTEYGANRHLDTDRDGKITVAEMMGPLRGHEQSFVDQDDPAVRAFFRKYNQDHPRKPLTARAERVKDKTGE